MKLRKVLNWENAVKNILFINLIVAIICLFLTFKDPSQPNRSIILNYSLSRILIGSIIAIGAVVNSLLIFSLRRKTLDQILLDRGSPQSGVIFTLLLLFIVGVILLFSHLNDAGGVLANYFWRLLPYSIWSSIAGASGLLIYLTINPQTRKRNTQGIIYLLIVLLAGTWLSIRVWPAFISKTEDIYFTFIEGKRLISGINPYERIVVEGYRTDGKYPTYFAAFYLLSGFTQLIGLSEFDQWLVFWRVVFLTFSLLITASIYFRLYKKLSISLAVFAAAFWLLNRWTLHVIRVSEMDLIPIFFLLLSISTLKSKSKLSFLLFGISLSFKQIAIFLLPVYIGWAWKYHHNQSPIKGFVGNLILLAAIPLLTTGPFLVIDIHGFIQSMLVSLQRAPSVIGNIYSLDALLGLTGIIGKVPLFSILMIVYLLSINSKLEGYPSTLSLLVLFSFVGLNSVYFPTYLVWVIPLFLMSLSEIVPEGRAVNSKPLFTEGIDLV